jgi:hypothetical protein
MMNQNNPFVVYVQQSVPNADSLVQKERKEAEGSIRPTAQRLKTNEMLGWILQSLWHQTMLPFNHRSCCTMQNTKPLNKHPRILLLVRNVSAEATSRIVSRLSTASAARRVEAAVPFRTLVEALASDFGRRVVVVVAHRLENLHGDLVFERTDVEELSSNDRANDERQEDHQEDKVENGVTDHSALAKLRLLQRVDRGTDLTTMMH